MSSHTLLFRVALVVIVVLVGYITIPSLLKKDAGAPYSQESVAEDIDTQVADTASDTTDVNTEVREVSDDVGKDDDEGVSTQSDEVAMPDAPVKAITSDPIPEVPAVPAGYTEAIVATHNSEASCWSIIDGNVYDLTSFIGDHPGGERNILKICGKDGTSAFMGQHGGESRPENTLAGFLLGPLTE